MTVLSPKQIRQAQFDVRVRGYDRDQVHELLEAAALALESTRNDAMAIERRFRAAAARVQELSAARPDDAAGDAAGTAGPPTPPSGADDAGSDRQAVLEQIAGLERRRADLEREILQRAEVVRAQQTRLRAVAESLRDLADRHFDLDSAVGSYAESVSGATGSSEPLGSESSDREDSETADGGSGDRIRDDLPHEADEREITGADGGALCGPSDPGRALGDPIHASGGGSGVEGAGPDRR